eukprot:gnl/Dysnectes_brevis/3920_a5101_947.p1 GENE.gnl/Dysnectes_brevis/3920_a5101_947~~gnl/Dysnectes_brevis/3920_a5101_947.p1  ORF type:complete len:268 (+),score=28.88 gnl/Dysnectes_brevis/3920_a5101_947:1177-1980(+)
MTDTEEDKPVHTETPTHIEHMTQIIDVTDKLRKQDFDSLQTLKLFLNTHFIIPLHFTESKSRRSDLVVGVRASCTTPKCSYSFILLPPYEPSRTRKTSRDWHIGGYLSRKGTGKLDTHSDRCKELTEMRRIPQPPPQSDVLHPSSTPDHPKNCRVVACPHHANSAMPCSWKGTTCRLPNHLTSECLLSVVPCHNARHGCTASVARFQMPEHLSTECQHCGCDDCTVVFTSNADLQHHLKKDAESLGEVRAAPDIEESDIAPPNKRIK